MHIELPKYFSSAFLDDELDFGDGSVAVGVRHRPSYRETQRIIKLISLKGQWHEKVLGTEACPKERVHNRNVVTEYGSR